MSKIEEAAKPMGFNVNKKNYKVNIIGHVSGVCLIDIDMDMVYQMKLQGDRRGRKGQLAVVTEVFEVAPSLHMVELRKTGGDTLEFHKACIHPSHLSFFHYIQYSYCFLCLHLAVLQKLLVGFKRHCLDC